MDAVVLLLMGGFIDGDDPDTEVLYLGDDEEFSCIDQVEEKLELQRRGKINVLTFPTAPAPRRERQQHRDGGLPWPPHVVRGEGRGGLDRLLRPGQGGGGVAGGAKHGMAEEERGRRHAAVGRDLLRVGQR